MFLFLLFLSGCSGNVTLPEQSRADQIRVERNFPQEKLAEILDQKKIGEIIAFINSNREGWGVPWYGPPVGQIYLRFYKEQKYNGNFYVGANFFGRDTNNFFSKSASNTEIQKLSDLLDIDLLRIIHESP